MRQGHLIELPGSDWTLWRECSLRSAGFPVALAARFTDAEVVADSLSGIAPEVFATRYGEAVDRSVAALRSFVELPRFREAVAWQNPAILHNWLSKLAHSGDDRKLRKNRYMRAVASYAQRYFTKNDTIGFFGPVGWANWDASEPGLRVVTGAGLLRERATYFETWAVEALAHKLSTDPRLLPWLRPRLVAGCWRDGQTVNRPYTPPFRLDAGQSALLAACDGTSTVAQLTELFGTSAHPDASGVVAQLTAWRDAELVQLDFSGPVAARPELRLREQLGSIDDDETRKFAIGELDRLEAARDRLALNRGDPEGVAEANVELARVFEELTDQKSSRNDGQMYAGRTLAYEDTLRDVDVTLGASVLQALAPPLRIVLDSAAWLIARAGQVLHERLRDLVRAYLSETGSETMPFPALLARATPILHPWNPGDSPLNDVRTEFQDRWARVLGPPATTSRLTVAAPDIAERAALHFPPAPAPWPGAIHLSPDIMIAARDAQAVNDGDFSFVLGELHLANNTLQARPFIEMHDDPARLLAATQADFGDERVYYVPTRKSPQVNSRAYPSALLSPSYTYWCLHDDTGGAAGPVLAAGTMTVFLDGHRLRVRESGDGRVFDLLDVLDEQLAWSVADIFAPVAKRRHQPRVTIDKLVLHRESWHFGADDLDWAFESTPAQRFRQAQHWCRAWHLPTRVFFKLSTEEKPCFLDFASVALVECFAQAVRAAAEQSGEATVGVSEMLPDLHDAWLAGPDGETYTSELRFVAVNPHGPTHASHTPS